LIPLQTLRSRIAIIPQDAPIFTGTVRTNLDPLSVHDDTEIWTVLGHAQLLSHIASLPKQLSTPVEESGSNFSFGQRQLLSLARALLQNTKILVLDEATASVDIETDRILQKMLKGDVLKGRTTITVAHRIETILDSNRVVVLEKGRVAESGAPRELMEQAGLFYKLVVEAGLEDKVAY
jgi:ABC-type multidrug transport system fused ATPase/permease subunit